MQYVREALKLLQGRTLSPTSAHKKVEKAIVLVKFASMVYSTDWIDRTFPSNFTRTYGSRTPI